MIYPTGWAPIYARWRHRLSAWRYGFSRPKVAWGYSPEPYSIGNLERGRRIVAGHFDQTGHVLEARSAPLWDLAAPEEAIEIERHGFSWLDDLAAYPNRHTRQIAQNWALTWVSRFGHGSGPGWVPDLTGRRIIRLLHHSAFLRQGLTPDQDLALRQSLAKQTLFLNARWAGTTTGLPRFEAICGLIYGALSLKGYDYLVGPATEALTQEFRAHIGESGASPARSAEDLLDILTLLIWSAEALRGAGWTPSETHQKGIAQIAPVLRGLRHADGSLPRVHGGGRGYPGRLEAALAACGRQSHRGSGEYMGYARLSSGRSTVIADAAAPPQKVYAYCAHAATLAFELTVGRRPIVVNCGSGQRFGKGWRRVSRETAAHSTLQIGTSSSARFGTPRRHAGIVQDAILKESHLVRSKLEESQAAYLWSAHHNGFAAQFGLSHQRSLSLMKSGLALVGNDLISARSKQNRASLKPHLENKQKTGLAYTIRFHLHPDVSASFDRRGISVILRLKNGVFWNFRHDGALQLSLEESIYLEKSHLQPKQSKQIVLTGQLLDYEARVKWSFAQAVSDQNPKRDLEAPALDEIQEGLWQD